MKRRESLKKWRKDSSDSQFLLIYNEKCPTQMKEIKYHPYKWKSLWNVMCIQIKTSFYEDFIHAFCPNSSVPATPLLKYPCLSTRKHSHSDRFILSQWSHLLRVKTISHFKHTTQLFFYERDAEKQNKTQMFTPPRMRSALVPASPKNAKIQDICFLLTFPWRIFFFFFHYSNSSKNK